MTLEIAAGVIVDNILNKMNAKHAISSVQNARHLQETVYP
jgi:hypothetical protein